MYISKNISKYIKKLFPATKACLYILYTFIIMMYLIVMWLLQTKFIYFCRAKNLLYFCFIVLPPLY